MVGVLEHQVSYGEDQAPHAVQVFGQLLGQAGFLEDVEKQVAEIVARRRGRIELHTPQKRDGPLHSGAVLGRPLGENQRVVSRSGRPTKLICVGGPRGGAKVVVLCCSSRTATRAARAAEAGRGSTTETPLALLSCATDPGQKNARHAACPKHEVASSKKGLEVGGRVRFKGLYVPDARLLLQVQRC